MERLPRVIRLGPDPQNAKIACIQASGCAPMAQAFELDSAEIME